MKKKVYESKKLYSQKYNKSHSTVQIERELYIELKEFVESTNISLREYISNLIKNHLVQQKKRLD